MAAAIRLPMGWRAARATAAIAILTALGWLGLMILPSSIEGIEKTQAWWAVSLVVHANFIHLALNLLALILFGRSVEPAVGMPGLILLYVAGHAAAFAACYFVGLMTWFGAGGGTGAVLGAYALLFGRNPNVRSRHRLTPWRYALWLCVGWITMSLLVAITYAGRSAIYLAPPYFVAFVLGLILAKPLILLHYRNA